MLTDLSKIGTNFEVDFKVDFQGDFEVDVSFFILHFSESHFYKFLVKKKKNHDQYTQIKMVFFKLTAQNYHLFNFTFYLTI